MKEIHMHHQMAGHASFMGDCIKLPKELETTGNNGDETSLSLLCHGNNKTSCREGTNPLPIVGKRTDCIFLTLAFPHATTHSE
jgi:hypothetical protein